LKEPDDSVPEAVLESMNTADVLVSTTALVYLDIEVIASIVGVFASKQAEGY
jgi:hypothetical protein